MPGLKLNHVSKRGHWSSTHTNLNNHRLIILSFAPRMLFSDLVLRYHRSSICDIMCKWGTGIVMWYMSIVFACKKWHKGHLHESITTIPPPCAHSLASKNSFATRLTMTCSLWDITNNAWYVPYIYCKINNIAVHVFYFELLKLS